MTTFVFRLEAFAARVLLRVFQGLGPVRASNLGGAIARTIGPLLPVTRVAKINLRLAMPELGVAGHRRIVRGAWDNLGRTIGEFPHIAGLTATASGPGWELVGEETLRVLATGGRPVIFVSGHIGNWEVLPAACASYGLPFSSMFRSASNPAVDALVTRLRQQAVGAPVPMFSKGAAGAKAAMAHLRSGGHLGLLTDQKMNDGVAATLFGHTAMTASAMAVLALRYCCAVVPGHVQRIGPARFRLVCEPVIPLPDTGDRKADVMTLTQAMNDHLERWIRARPEGWLWMHRRWPSALYYPLVVA